MYCSRSVKLIDVVDTFCVITDFADIGYFTSTWNRTSKVKTLNFLKRVVTSEWVVSTNKFFCRARELSAVE